MATIYARNKTTNEWEKVGPAANATDSTLTLQGSPADAKATGDAINNIQTQINDITIEGGGSSSAVNSHNTSTTAHADIREQISQLFSEKVALSGRVTNLENDVVCLQAEGLQQVPEYSDSIDGCTDTSKVYVLPDGYIYGYMQKTETVVIPSQTVTVPAKVALIPNKVYSKSSAAFNDNSTVDCLVVPLDASDNQVHTIDMVGMSHSSTKTALYFGTSNSTFTSEVVPTHADSNRSSFTLDCSKTGANKYFTFAINTLNGSYDGIALSIDGVACDIVVTTDSTVAAYATTTTTEETTETHTIQGFVNTGHAFVPADYEDRIIALENRSLKVVRSDDEMVDKDKIYILDNCIYQYGEKTEEVEVEGETVPNFTNLKDECSYKYGYRYSISSGGYVSVANHTSVSIPVPTKEEIVLRIKNATATGYGAINSGSSSDLFDIAVSSVVANGVLVNEYWYSYPDSDGCYTLTITKNAEHTYLDIHLAGTSASDFENLIITVDEPIEYKAKTETIVVGEGFVNTGLCFVSEDYENRLNTVENAVANVDVEVNLADYINSVLCPEQLPANGEEGSDFNLHTFNDFGEGFHSYFDDLLVRYPHYIVREYLGKDESETINMYRYVLGKHYYSAWCKENYPRMYAWKNGDTIIYSVSISPRLGDTMYSTKYIGTSYGTITAVSATNRSRTVNSLEFVRYESMDVNPTVCYTPSYNPYNRLVNANGALVIGISTVNGNVLTDANGVVYNRYPFGDLKKDGTKPIHMTIITNEHGGDTEPAIPTLVAARLIRDLCNGQRSTDNPIYRYLRDNVQMTFVTPVNPHGLNKYASGDASGYRNANNININRNYDTVGWDYCYNNQDIDGNAYLGSYVGSENETQYVMNTMVDSKADIAMSVHTISCGVTTTTRCNYQGQNPNGDYTQYKIDEIADDMKSSYNLDFFAYNPLYCPPETTAKSPSFITQIGAYGGIVEFQCHEPFATEEEYTDRTTMFTKLCMEQNYSLLLKFIAMWLSDYLEGR